MDFDSMRRAVESARHAYRDGFYITADTHMRHALAEANRLRRRDLAASIFRIRNKLRPLVRSALPQCTG